MNEEEYLYSARAVFQNFNYNNVIMKVLISSFHNAFAVDRESKQYLKTHSLGKKKIYH